jgi:alkanesulfonate monooxygenase SsuD/methylene tetrahydromethanopterin reductase-like flavin-dependent oxidoreductase (luciferase family)
VSTAHRSRGPERIRTGVVLPIFQDDADLALSVTRRAEEAGIDGVFCYDHLWPLGQPERPALAPFPVLGLVAATTRRVVVGTLVARVGLVPDDVLLAQFAALEALAPGRVIAGLGTGDRLSAGENEAYGVTFAEADDRRRSLRACVRAIAALGPEVWVGNGDAATRAIAADEGAALNVWDAPPERVAEEAARAEVTWGGPAPGLPGALQPMVERLAEAGATWAVFPWPVDLDELAATSPGR